MANHDNFKKSSVEGFMNTKGGYVNGCKDVYFLRIVGINQGTLGQIEAMDRTLTAQMKSGRGFYYRCNSLPRLAAMEDVDFYSGCYESWVNSGKTCASVKSTGKNQQVCQALGTACQKVLGIFAKAKPGMNPSIEKNFVVKILFWLDQTAAAALQAWEPECSRKVVCADVSRQQEYLFCYLLTLLGFDVLLLQTGQDIPPELDKLGLSQKSITANPGVYKIPEYMPERHAGRKEGAARVLANTGIPARYPDRGNPASSRKEETARILVNTRVPERDRRTQQMLSRNNRTIPGNQNFQAHKETAARSNMPSTGKERAGGYQEAGRQHPQAGRRELTYEELAVLASSVVQIMIHDGRGDIIGGGSGIMIGSAGYILTNNHVACRGRSYSVRIEEDERVYRTDEMIKYNSVLDLAVIRIDRKLQPLPIYKGERKLVRGQRVVAIGSPLGLFNSVSDGIISGFRMIEDVSMIQFTAPISNGSSGGAVLNMYGEVIGISTAGFDNGQNINLAVGYEYIGNFIRGFLV